MARPKSGGSKKKQTRGVDFKKFKRKLGRKLPPPKNYTDTEIKFKAIVLPEQSVASDRAGIAVNKKGLTLRELLQQTSHHNAKFRKAALTGIKDFILKHTSELKLHKIVVVEKLRERMCDTDRNVRDTLYQLLENEIFPILKEDSPGPVISILMAYIFNAMTHMAVDIRLMAFRFFNLIVQSFPSSFILYAEKVLDSYIDILRNNQIYLQEKNKLKNVLDGLVRCISSFESRRDENYVTNETSTVKPRRLHSFETVVHKDNNGTVSVLRKFDDLLPILVNCFRESTSLLDSAAVCDIQSYDCMLKILQCIHSIVKIYVKETGSQLSSVSISRRNILIHLSKFWASFPVGNTHSSNGKENERYFVFNVRIIQIFLHLSDCLDDRSIPVEKFLEFLESLFQNLLPWQGTSQLPTNNSSTEKHFGPIVLFIPKLVASQVISEWKIRLLEAFTCAFVNSKVDSKLTLAYLSAIEEMLDPAKSDIFMSLNMLGSQIIWIQHLPKMLLLLGDKHSSISKVVLMLLLKIGQRSPPNSTFGMEYDNLQFSLKGLYSNIGFNDDMAVDEVEKEDTKKIIEPTHSKDPLLINEEHTGDIHCPLFLKLPKDCQELAVCTLYYISSLSSDFILALTNCCLSNAMQLEMLLRIIDVLHSAYKSGHLLIEEHMGFLLTLVAHKEISDGDGKVFNRKAYRYLNSAACSCLSQMGDNAIVLKMLFKSIMNEMSRKLPLDIMYGLFRMIASLDLKLTKLSDDNIDILCNWLSAYLVDVAISCTATHKNFQTDSIRKFRYYAQPCIYLFIGCGKVLVHVLELFSSSLVDDSNWSHGTALNSFQRVYSVCSILIFVHDDERLHKMLAINREARDGILQNVSNILVTDKYAWTLEEKHDIQSKYDQLKSKANKMMCPDSSILERV